MEAKKKRLTLDLDPIFQRRLKAIDALKGVSMRGYCQAAINRELTVRVFSDLPTRHKTSGLSEVDPISWTE